MGDAERTSATTARAYLACLRACRIGQTEMSSGRPFTEAFVEVFGAPSEPTAHERYYLELLGAVTIPEARVLCALERPQVLHDALGVSSREALLACAAVTLYLRTPKKRPAGRLAARFDSYTRGGLPLAQGTIDAARRRILHQVRFHLQQIEPLRFLASARLTHKSEHGADPIGFGSDRIGVYGYSHFARECLFLATLEWFGEGALDALEQQCAQIASVDGHEHTQTVPTVVAACDSPGRTADPDDEALAAYVLDPISRDLWFLDRRRTFTNADGAGAQDWGNAAFGTVAAAPRVDLNAAIKELEKKSARFERKIAACRRELHYLGAGEGDASPAAADNVGRERINTVASRLDAALASAAALAERIGWYKFMREARRQSTPLLAGDERASALYRDVCRIFDVCASHEVTFGRRGGPSSSFADAMRLHFAFQLLSFLKEERYTAADRERIVAELGEIFSSSADADTGDALAALTALGDRRQLFGEAFVAARNRLVRAVLAATEARTAMTAAQRRTVDEHLSRLPHDSALFGPLPTIEGSEAMCLVEIQAWAEDALWRLEMRAAAPLLAALEALRRSVGGHIEHDAFHQLGEGLRALSIESQRPPRLDAAGRNALQHLAAILPRPWRECEERIGAATLEQRFRDEPDLSRRYIATRLLLALVERLLREAPPAAELGASEVKHFFSRTFPGHRTESWRQRWLFVAVKVAFEHEAAGIGHIFHRVSNHLGEWRQSAYADKYGSLPALYKHLCNDAGFRRDIHDALAGHLARSGQ